jgi:hypothetical protein
VPMHNAGSMHNAMKARILPEASTVTEGYTRNTAAIMIVSTIKAIRIPVSPSISSQLLRARRI